MTRKTIVSNVPMGDVYIRNFDEGMYAALDYFEEGKYAFVPSNLIPTVKPPMWCENHKTKSQIGTRMPGIPILWGLPDDSIRRYNIPCIRINPEDPSPALERRRSLHLKSRSPSPGANPVTVTLRGGVQVEGFDSYEEQYGSWPMDIPYTLICEAAGDAAKKNVVDMLLFLQKRFPPYAILEVVDSLQAIRKYNCFVEGPSSLSEVADIRDRTMVYALSIRVSGEFDLEDFRRVKVIRSRPSFNGMPGVPE